MTKKSDLNLLNVLWASSCVVVFCFLASLLYFLNLPQYVLLQPSGRRCRGHATSRTCCWFSRESHRHCERTCQRQYQWCRRHHERNIDEQRRACPAITHSSRRGWYDFLDRDVFSRFKIQNSKVAHITCHSSTNSSIVLISKVSRRADVHWFQEVYLKRRAYPITIIAGMRALCNLCSTQTYSSSSLHPFTYLRSPILMSSIAHKFRWNVRVSRHMERNDGCSSMRERVRSVDVSWFWVVIWHDGDIYEQYCWRSFCMKTDAM